MSFLSVLRNRLKVLFSDRLFVLAILIFPVLLSMISGYAQKKEKLGHVPVFLVDIDDSESSELLMERLFGKEGFIVKTGTEEEGQKAVTNDDVEALLIIEKGFERNLERGNTEGLVTLFKSPSTYSSELIKEIVSSEILRIYSADFTYNLLRQSFDDIKAEDIELRVEDYWQPNPIMTIDYEEIRVVSKEAGNITIPPYTAASLGLLVLFIMLGLLFGSGWQCEEKINGTIQRAMSVKGALTKLFLGNISALFIMGIFLCTVFILVQWILFGVLIINGILSLLVLLSYILCVTSISMLLAAAFETPHQLQASAPVIALVTGIMGGCLWNLAGVPGTLLSISLLTPQGWAIRALTSLYGAPERLYFALPGVTILMGASIIIFLVSFVSLKRTVSKI